MKQLLSQEFANWSDAIDLDAPQLVNRQRIGNPVQHSFSEIRRSTIESQYKPENFNFSEELDLAMVMSPEMEEDFQKNLLNGKYVAELENAIGELPMNVFGNGIPVSDAEAEETGANPEDFIALKNEQNTPSASVGTRNVVPLTEGDKILGSNTNPVADVTEALPENQVLPGLEPSVVYPENNIVSEESSVQDNVSKANVEIAEDNVFDQMEQKHQEELAAYKEFMANPVM